MWRLYPAHQGNLFTDAVQTGGLGDIHVVVRTVKAQASSDSALYPVGPLDSAVVVVPGGIEEPIALTFIKSPEGNKPILFPRRTRGYEQS